MVDKRNGMDMPQLPSGRFAEYVWDGLSETMRDVFRGIDRRGEDHLRWAHRQTLVALEKRRLLAVDVDYFFCLTEDGKALVGWIRDVASEVRA
jgi:hypothetical protein